MKRIQLFFLSLILVFSAYAQTINLSQQPEIAGEDVEGVDYLWIVDSSATTQYRSRKISVAELITALNIVVTHPVQLDTGTIVSSEILTSFTSPVTVIPAPGAGKYLNIISLAISIEYSGSPYSWSSGSAFFRYEGGGNQYVANFTAVLNATSDLIEIYSEDVFTGRENEAFVFLSTSVNPSGGTSDMKWKILYSIEDK